MRLLPATALAIALAALASPATAQSYGTAPAYNQGGGEYGSYDFARVTRVDPVYGGYGNQSTSGQRCYTRQETVAGGYRNDGYYEGDGYYRNDGYNRDGYYRNDGYRQDGYYGNDGYRQGGTQAGRNIATVIGGIVGAAVGSQMGGGSGRYATSAIGSMVGGMAGQQVYENSVRQRQQQRPQTATVQVCDPVPAGDRYYGTSGSGVTAYDVTYEYAGRSYTTRMNHHPGDRVRVRVDVAE